MFQTITTSAKNKELVTKLTNSFGLGAENIIARLALAHSLATGIKLQLKDIADSKGKSYSSKTLLGDYSAFYIALICQHYGIYKLDKDVSKYMKMHIDHGLIELESYANSDGLDFLISEVEKGLE
ncbi:DndE family protein [Pontibacter sp. G13]|uniref:DndE family protein n=1 Tax=Pontibacter sp. G13 TaxID=3074898 RepID=UPI00288A3CE8|nr:DndE family protein [Pontibacter sp. G13]WNJ17166.1 DndE family protein [Pontibacter sp. G13]